MKDESYSWVTYLQVAPLSLVFLLFLVVPIATIVVVSFFDYNTTQIIPALPAAELRGAAALAGHLADLSADAAVLRSSPGR